MGHQKIKPFGRLVALAMIIAMAVPLAACGRKASPERPGDAGYPHNYPSEPPASDDAPSDEPPADVPPAENAPNNP